MKQSFLVVHNSNGFQPRPVMTPKAEGAPLLYNHIHTEQITGQLAFLRPIIMLVWNPFITTSSRTRFEGNNIGKTKQAKAQSTIEIVASVL